MSKTNKKTDDAVEPIDPIRPKDFGCYEHKVPYFNATVSGSLKQSDLEDSKFWVHVAGQMTMGCDVRCIAADMSFVAYGTCTYAQGSTARVKIHSMHKLDSVVKDLVADPSDDYVVEMRGVKKWCIVQKSTGEVILEDIPDQLEAMRELGDYKKALRS